MLPRHNIASVGQQIVRRFSRCPRSNQYVDSIKTLHLINPLLVRFSAADLTEELLYACRSRRGAGWSTDVLQGRIAYRKLALERHQQALQLELSLKEYLQSHPNVDAEAIRREIYTRLS